jgi:hypothetical protein
MLKTAPDAQVDFQSSCDVVDWMVAAMGQPGS